MNGRQTSNCDLRSQAGNTTSTTLLEQKIITDYEPKVTKSPSNYFDDIINIFKESMSRLERENIELKEQMTKMSEEYKNLNDVLSQSKKIQSEVQEELIRVTGEKKLVEFQLSNTETIFSESLNQNKKVQGDLQEEITRLTGEMKLMESKSSRNENQNNKIQSELQEEVTRLTGEIKLMELKLVHNENQSNKIQGGLREEIIRLTEEKKLIESQLLRSESILTEEKLKTILNENSIDLIDKLDENFKLRVNMARERNIHIREGNPFPFTPERLSNPLFVPPWLAGINGQRKL